MRSEEARRVRMKTRRPVVVWTVSALLGVFAGGCDGNDDSITQPDPGDEPAPTAFATIEGSVEETTEVAASRAPSSLAFAPMRPRASRADEAATVAAAEVRADGSLEFLAEADVGADGRFTIEEVPTGRTNLVVAARSEAGEEVGRVLVHGETRADAALSTTPINAETTVEGLVFATLAASGAPAEVRDAAQLALLLRMEESTAADVASSAQAIQEVAGGVRAEIEALDGAFVELGGQVNGRLKAEGMLDAARKHAQDRLAGADAEAAAQAFLEAGVAALIEAGAEAEEASLATSAAATGLDRAMAEADARARLDLAKNAVALNLLAREALLAELDETESKQEGAEALAQARVEVGAATSVGEVAQALAEAESSFEATLTERVLTNLPQVPDAIRAQVQARLETAFAEANLSARIEAAGTVDEIVAAVAQYREAVRTAVEAFVEALPSSAGAELRAQVSAELLIAVQGGPDLTSPEAT